jgi:CBS domain-containing protein
MDITASTTDPVAPSKAWGEGEAMKIQDIMTANPACCTPGTGIPQVAELMVAHDCGALPVVESETSHLPVGIVTDRDIVVRLVARGEDTRESRVRDVMTDVAVTVDAEADLEEARRRMEDHQLRRLMVVRQDGTCVGLVSLADVAGAASPGEAGAVLQEVSRPRSGSERVST